MIGSLKGILVAKMPPQVLLDVNGVGYDVDVPMSTFYALPELGKEVTLRTHLAIREDAHCLYGFMTETERKAFRLLLKISGIGARTAMGVLSGMSVPELADAISRQDVAKIIGIPGIGKKTAERLLLELKDSASRLAPAADGSGGETQSSIKDDVASALVALGYSAKEVSLAVKDMPLDVDVSAGIRLALKNLAK